MAIGTTAIDRLTEIASLASSVRLSKAKRSSNAPRTYPGITIKRAKRAKAIDVAAISQAVKLWVIQLYVPDFWVFREGQRLNRTFYLLLAARRFASLRLSV